MKSYFWIWQNAKFANAKFVVFLELSFEAPHGCSESLFLCSAKWMAKQDSRDSREKEARTISSIFQMFCKSSGEPPQLRLVMYFSDLLGLVILQLAMTIEKQRDPDEGAQV